MQRRINTVSQQENPQEAEDMPQMSFIGHLAELRDHLIKALLSVTLVFVCLVGFSKEIYAFVATPVINVLPAGVEMIATEMTSTLFAPLKLTFFLSVMLAIPLILHQAWSFIAPGLYQHEKKIAIPLLIMSVFLFYAGIAFAYFFVLPMLVGFFSLIAPDGVEFMPDIQNYLNMVLKLFFAFGAAFEIPVAIILLIWSGVVSRETIISKRSYVVVGCFVIAMLLTPPDIFSQTLLAIPMWGLFELGLVISKVLKPRPRKNEEEQL
tara:strand:- start:1046 stop:1840 length:795 start_codon:yes stop_codon:yes gene_type:complete